MNYLNNDSKKITSLMPLYRVEALK